MDSNNSSTCSQHPQLPPGFRFHPTDEELVVHYLKNKVASAPLPITIIAEIDLYKFDPWELPSKAAVFGEQEWYFFSPRDRKYPNGARPNRAATSGYWKATGTDKPILTSNSAQKVGVKKALVFYGGKPPKGIKTNWIMHEYRLLDNNSTTKFPHPGLGTKKASLRLDDWVLCRIFKKNDTSRLMERDKDELVENIITSNETKAPSFSEFLENEHESYFQSSIDRDVMQYSCISKSAVKRTFPSQQYWNEMGSVESSSGKRFHVDHQDNISTDAEGNILNGSLFSLLNHPPFELNNNNNTVVGSVGDVLHQPYQLSAGMNWNF